MKIPCVECISFAICKQRVKGMNTPDLTIFSTNIECDRIKGFIDYIDSPKFHQNRERVKKNERAINEARDVFGLTPISIDYRIP